MSDVSSRPKLIKGCQKISEYLGISKMQVYRGMNKGLMPGCFKIGNEYYCDPALVEKDTAELKEAEKARARETTFPKRQGPGSARNKQEAVAE
jgi:hypothetical protein